tara:strand:- start:375 stop:824 length:450 start_codon:yes stop_codon:yes gene_type:complete
MILKEEIRLVANKKALEMGCYIVDLKVSTNNQITIFFDKKEGILIDDCSELSKYIEENFDRDIEDYELTVCSAGLESPFLVKEQYEKNIGKEVKVLMNNGQSVEGILLEHEDGVVIEKNNKIKKNTFMKSEMAISANEIKEVKLKINYK